MRRWLAIALTAAAILAASPPRAAQAWSDFCCLPWAQPAQLAITPDGRFAYASDYKAVLALARNTQTGGLRVVDSYSVHGGGTTELSPDGRTLYIAASQYGTLAEF